MVFLLAYHLPIYKKFGVSQSYPPRMLFSFMIGVKVDLALFGTQTQHAPQQNMSAAEHLFLMSYASTYNPSFDKGKPCAFFRTFGEINQMGFRHVGAIDITTNTCFHCL